jgi:hypothetical protein
MCAQLFVGLLCLTTACARTSFMIFELSVYTRCKGLATELSHRGNIPANKAGRGNTQGILEASDTWLLSASMPPAPAFPSAAENGIRL